MGPSGDRAPERAGRGPPCPHLSRKTLRPVAEMWRRPGNLRRTLSGSMLDLGRYPLEDLASRVGTPFYFYDGDMLRASAQRFAEVVGGPTAAGRYAMKANSC